MNQDLNFSEANACDNDKGVHIPDRTQLNDGLNMHNTFSDTQVVTLENQSDLAVLGGERDNPGAVVAEDQPDENNNLETETLLSREVISTIEGFEAIRDAWSEFNVDLMNSFSWNL